MLKAFIFIMLVVSAASAFPTGAEIGKKLALTGGQMATCILKRKATSAAGNLWKATLGRIFGGRRLLTRNLNVFTDAAKGLAKKVALPLCNSVGYKSLEFAAKQIGPESWDGDAQACARELVATECNKVINGW
jgi:hypothetical protein